ITALFALCAMGFVAAQEGAGASALPNVSFSTGYVIANYEGVRVENGTVRGATRYTDDISFEDEKLFGGLDGGKAINKPNELIAATAVLNSQQQQPKVVA
ncbi:MAG: hypothetical protein LBB98_15145, partial [Treponema sp.]|nr:hypothetical protein [Treponema sp.]